LGLLSEPNFSGALLALVINKMQIGVAFVQKPLFADLKAIRADPMDWLGAAHR
jgi:hypothetical protein